MSWQGAWHSGRWAHTQAQSHPERPQSSIIQDDYQDPFEAAMRGKTEKELMDLILQRGQRELADEEAAEVRFAGDTCVLGDADAYVPGRFSCLSMWLSLEKLCMLQAARVKERGEHGGPQGAEPTRYGQSYKLELLVLTHSLPQVLLRQLCCWMQGTGRKGEDAQISKEAQMCRLPTDSFHHHVFADRLLCCQHLCET